MISPSTKKLINELKKTNLSTEDRVALTSCVFNELGVLPIGEMLVVNEMGISINGKDMDAEQVIHFKNTCAALQENYARKVLAEQIRYKAIEMGIMKATSIDTLMFSKAAIWVLNEYEVLLTRLAKI